MPRKVTWGTPSRSEHYAPLRPAYLLLAVSALVCLLASGFFGLLQVTGLRGPLAPGALVSGHAAQESRCEACHVAGHGVSNLRCQRCHDAGGGGRLKQAAHVLFGSGDARKAAAAPELECARCHLEHRGRQAALRAVPQPQCLLCHAALLPARHGQAFRIGALGEHPEFRLLREGLQGDPRLLFSHKVHMKEMVKEAVKAGAPQTVAWDTCVRCHAPDRTGRRDLEPIRYEPHCARCHAEDLAMLPVPAADVEEEVGLREAAGALQRIGDNVQRPDVRHQDAWILYNVRQLQWQLHPEAFARDRAALQARISQLERRLAQADPLVGLGLDALREREAAVSEELRRLQARAQGQPSAVAPGAGLARLDEAVAAAAAAGDAAARTRAEQALGQARGLGGAAPQALPPADFEERRRELLAVLDALAAAEPERRRTFDDLRRRLLALSPGEPAADNLDRALRQRREDLARVRDEMELRRSGTPAEARALPERGALQRELDAARAELQSFYSFSGEAPALSDSERARKLKTLKALSGEGGKERCAKCHLIAEGSFATTRPARSVLVRATFAHAKHLVAPLPEAGAWQRLTGMVAAVRGRQQAPSPEAEAGLRFRCAYCHRSIEAAGDAPRPPAVPGVQSCRECHRAGAAREDCQLCHRYHPPGAAS